MSEPARSLIDFLAEASPELGQQLMAKLTAMENERGMPPALSVANVKRVRDAHRVSLAGGDAPSGEHLGDVGTILNAITDALEADTAWNDRSASAKLLGYPFLMQRALVRVAAASIDQTQDEREHTEFVLRGTSEQVAESDPAVAHLLQMLASVVSAARSGG